MRYTSWVFAVIAVLGFVTPSRADLVLVVVEGDVAFNVIGGDMTNVPDGAPVSMSFQVDSNVFINSASFPTRGYAINLSTFNMVVGGVPVPIVNPQPDNMNRYFVLRNNDPAVDGFFMSAGPDFPSPTIVTIPGLAPQHDLDFSVSYDNGNVITSLNILNAFGTYGLTGIGSFGWTIGRFGNAGAEYNFETLTISPVPEPTSLALTGAGVAGIAFLRRRKKR